MIAYFSTILVLLAPTASALPLVDPGLFVISGVSTCGNGTGYCLLGVDCRMNQDFIADPSGHCTGLKGAFTPSAHFVCCTSPQAINELQPTTPPIDNITIVLITVMENQTESASTILTTTPSISTMLTTSGNYTENSTTVLTTVAENQTETATVASTNVTTAATTTITASHQTITSPPDYFQVDIDSEDDSENSVDWAVVTNLTEVADICPPCNPHTVFSLEGSPLCLGIHLRHGWVLTSGSCALSVFRAGMIKVVGKFMQDPEQEASVKTIAVHEDYRPYSSNILHPEPNNIGLILLSSEPRKACYPCIPDKEDKFAGKLCATTSNSTALAIKITKQDAMINNEVCESVVETMQGEGTEDFYTVACDSGSDSRYSVEESAESGKGLMCRGYVAGIETGSGTGLAVFTRVSLYSDWITTNMIQEQRQSFDTGDTL